MTAESLVQVHEPLKWKLHVGERVGARQLEDIVRRSFAGARFHYDEPAFLHAHQIEAYRRVRSTLRVYGGALLSDSVGLGKTFIALAVAKSFSRVLVSPPASIMHQWRAAATKVGVALHLVSHEAFSRGREILLDFELIIVDEAHRFRNPKTNRYRHLARCVMGADVLLITATPVVNGPTDLLHLFRLFLPDHGLALHGIPSLEAALRLGSRTAMLTHVSPMITARSPESAGIDQAAIPKSADAPIDASAPMPPCELGRVLAGIDALEFPAFGHREEARRLLRMHLLYRLHSSVQSLATTLRRHRTYLRHALESARCGLPMSRRDFRRVFDLEDHQLDLEMLFIGDGHDEIDVKRFFTELQRVDELIRCLTDRAATKNPKMERLVSYLASRSGQKTIVFVNAVPTANAIARRLRWAKLVLVTSGHARISSGPVPLTEGLQLFAPQANDMATPPARLTTDVLIATDILSEGVNLQDADAVVHYDLPWTSLRLQQRLGRISRLGTRFREVTVRWFVPPPAIERRLGLCRRITSKLQYQLQLGAPAASDVGRARITNVVLEKRELIISRMSHSRDRPPCHAVVRGPLSAVYAVEWTLKSGTTRDVIAANSDGEIITDLGKVCDLTATLFESEPSMEQPIPALQRRCEEAIRVRLAHALRGPTNHHVYKMGRRIVRRARAESKARRFHNLQVLDGVLQTIQAGLPVGAEAKLRDLMEADFAIDELNDWMVNSQRHKLEVIDVRVEAALFGDGSLDRGIKRPATR